jgi:hypothetical protein
MMFGTEERSHDMFWNSRKPTWHISPSKVTFGSVVENGSRNLSRSHVRVKYRREPEVQFVPVPKFIQRCHEVIQDGRSLDIEQLLIAPIIKQRYAKFFDRLTDWGPAARRAHGSPIAQQRPESRDR